MITTRTSIPVMAAAVILAVALAGCSAPPSGSEASVGTGPSGCLVADTAGINDHGFNEQAWAGLQDAESKLGSDVRYLQAETSNDYETDINAFLSQQCDLIVTVGFLMSDATQAASRANPEKRFAIVDSSFDPELPNVRGLVFATDEGAFQAGFAAAATSKSGVVGTFGGVKIAPVELYMDGFARGVAYYNELNGKNVQVLGWDTGKQDGAFVGNFTDQEAGKQIAQGMMQQGADVIFPAAATASLGAFAAVKANGNGVKAIKANVDGCESDPDFCDIFLTSVLKKVEVAVFDSMSTVADDDFQGTTYVGTLANDGVGIAKISADLPADTQKQLDDITAQISDGSYDIGSPFAVRK